MGNCWFADGRKINLKGRKRLRKLEKIPPFVTKYLPSVPYGEKFLNNKNPIKPFAGMHLILNNS